MIFFFGTQVASWCASRLNMLKWIPVYLSFFILLEGCKAQSFIQPGKIWKDTDGNKINAHGGGILFDNGKYFWFGEIKSGKSRLPESNIKWDGYRVEAGGVSCYSSENLVDWKYEGVALKPEMKDSLHDLHPSKVIERPKVIYNDSTKKYVMWFHVDSEDYGFARAGVAVSDKITGPYTYLGSVQPGGNMSRDMTLFKDTDGKAYLFSSSENNMTMHIILLTGDYLRPSGVYKRVFIGKEREAPAVVKHKGKYFIITSACTGWSPNEAEYAVADSVMGEWRVMGNPCVGDNSDKTFFSQGTFILPVRGKENSYVFLADRWNKTDLEDSRHVWLSFHFKGDTIAIEWQEKWKPE